MSRKPKVDRARWPHVYSGPGTRDGLQNGTACRITGRRAGGLRIETADGKRWIVGKGQVERAA